MDWLRDTVLSLLCSLLNFDSPLCDSVQNCTIIHISGYHKPESYFCQVLAISHVKCDNEVAAVVACPGLSEAADSGSSPGILERPSAALLSHSHCTCTSRGTLCAGSAESPPRMPVHSGDLARPAAPLSLAAHRPPNSTLVWGELSIFYNDGIDPMTPIGGAATFNVIRMMARITGVDERRLPMHLVAVSAFIRA